MTATLQSTATLFVTPAALERLRAEVAELRTRRPALLEAITTGFAGGDSADQAAFAEEIASLAELDARIELLETRLSNAVVTDVRAGSGVVQLGSVVTVRFAGDDADERFVVGGPELADGDVSAVSPDSPMGRALVGAAPGDEVSYAAPRGSLTLTVVAC